MPVTKSAKKALRKDRRRTINNLPIRQDLKKILKQARENPSSKFFRQAVSALDRAVKKKIIHRNKSSRLKSRLAKLVKKRV